VSHVNHGQAHLSPAVMEAIRAFAVVLDDTPQFTAFENCARALQNDQVATDAIKAYQGKQQSLQMMFMMNAVSEDEQSELEQLSQAVFNNPTVTNYLQAQEELTALCRAAAALLSEKVGLKFSAKRSGCCG